MKKIIIVIIGVIITITILTILSFICREKIVLMENVDSSQVEKIIIYCGKDVTVTEEEDIKSLINIFKSMQLTKSSPYNKDGGGFGFDVYYTDGKKEHFAIKPDCVIVGEKTYKTDRDCCDEIRAIYENLIE